MKVGLLNAIRNHPAHPYPLQQVYEDYISDAVFAEELGFDFAWYGEHRATPDDWSPSPLVVMAAVAARTKRLRLAPSILCMPFHNPLRVAEDIATLDILSNGRIDFGVGVGSQLEEFEMFRIDPKEKIGRTWEAVELIRRCFTEEWGFSHEGKYFQFGPIKLNVRPVQKELPIWWGGFGPKNVTKAAQHGIHLLAGGTKQQSDFYDNALRAAGRDPAGYNIGPLMMVCIAETEEEAFAASTEGLCYFINFYTQRRPLDDGPGGMPRFLMTPEILRASAKDPNAPFAMFIGNPEQVAAQFQRIKAGERGRITHLPLAFRHAGMRTDVVRRSMQLFHKHVLPILKA